MRKSRGDGGGGVILTAALIGIPTCHPLGRVRMSRERVCCGTDFLVSSGPGLCSSGVLAPRMDAISSAALSRVTASMAECSTCVCGC